MTRWFLCLLSGSGALLVLGGCEALSQYLATPEGQESAGQLAGGVGGAIANPVNPLAWWDIFVGGGALLGAALGLKGAGKAAQAVGAVVKAKVINPTQE